MSYNESQIQICSHLFHFTSWSDLSFCIFHPNTFFLHRPASINSELSATAVFFDRACTHWGFTLWFHAPVDPSDRDPVGKSESGSLIRFTTVSDLGMTFASQSNGQSMNFYSLPLSLDAPSWPVSVAEVLSVGWGALGKQMMVGLCTIWFWSDWKWLASSSWQARWESQCEVLWLFSLGKAASWQRCLCCICNSIWPSQTTVTTCYKKSKHPRLFRPDGVVGCWVMKWSAACLKWNKGIDGGEKEQSMTFAGHVCFAAEARDDARHLYVFITGGKLQKLLEFKQGMYKYWNSAPW